MKTPFKWDIYSDQPHQLKDKNFKSTMRKKELKSLIKTYLIGAITIPISLVSMPFVKRKEINSSDFFSIGVDFQRSATQTVALIEELEVERVLIRFKLWEMDSLEELKEFILKIKDKKIEKISKI